MEPKSRSATPAAALTIDTAVAAFNRPYAPPMQSWPTTPYDLDSPMKRESTGSFLSDDASFELEESLPPPVRRNTRRNLSGSNDSLLVEDEWEMDETVNDASKLKGVYWPGMALFDSATPEMKRKRNQKKAFSVVQHLKATSETVEPEELIFDGHGCLRKRREITGNPDDDDDGSPLSGEVTPERELQPKRKTSRRPRQPLAERNTNTGRVLRRTRESHHPPFGGRKTTPYFDGVQEEDDDLTFGQPKPRKRTGLSIHRDNSGPDITFNHPAPPAMNLLNSGFRHPFHTHNPTPQPTYHEQQQQQQLYNRTHQRLPSFTSGGTFGGTFRPNNHGSHAPTMNLASFGQMNHNMMYQSSTASHFNNATAFAAFHHQYPTAQQNVNDQVFQQQTHNQADWDAIFGFPNNADNMLPNQGTQAFQINNDLTTVNPLFLSSQQPGPEDDQATISASPSE